jgi:hypothetical protein
MMRIVVFALVLSAASEARAGACLGEDEVVAEVAQLEAYAKSPKDRVGVFLCVRVAFADDIDIVAAAHRKLLRARIDKACTTILGRDHEDSECVELAVRLGKKSMAGVELFDVVSRYKLDVASWDRWTPTLWMLGELGDPRGAPIVRDAWIAAIDVAAAHEKAHHHNYLQAWAGWRKEAAGTLGRIGVAADKTFLEQQAAATKDIYVRQACLDAAKAIEHRLAP